MNQLHIVMNGKGGIGKSIVAYNLAQYLRSRDSNTLCIDTDPLTPTLSKYKSIAAKHIQIASDSEIFLNRFDEMIEEIVSTSADTVIDTGASTFLPIARYIESNKIFEFLKIEYEKDVFVHVVLNAQTQNDYLSTVASLEMIASSFGANSKIVVWLNEFGGSLELFEKSTFFDSIKDQIYGILKIRNPDELLLHDFKAMLQNFQTYEEAAADKSLYVIAKSRLTRLKTEIYQQLNQVI
jgi:shikimate kinase